MTAAILFARQDSNHREEWAALLDRRRRFNASGQDGRDFDIWMRSRGIHPAPQQLELFA